MFGFKRRRRKRLRQQTFPDQWRPILRRQLAPYDRLSAHQRTELEGTIHILLHEKHFEGCGGLDLTDDIRLTVAAHGALLLLNRETDFFPKLTSILIYPARYVVDSVRRLPNGTVVEGDEVRAGESWTLGTVVLSWDDTRGGVLNAHDGHNVALHEFAHQLDAESGSMNGAPRLPDAATQAEWQRVCTAEFDQLKRDLAARRRTVLRPYAATSPPEFFAVATEAFFERSTALRRRHPDLYHVLSHYYAQDPATDWSTPP